MLKEKVIEVKHYSDRLFSFKTTRDKTFRFKNGEFAMIGLDIEPKKIMRAYSIVSTNYDDYLEFLSIKVENGPLTSRLQNIQIGDEILVNPKCTGSLVVDYLLPKKNLILLATGTGVAPFVSIAKDPATYDRFENVYLFHTVRKVAEITYKSEFTEVEKYMPLTYVPSVTREQYFRQGRFWNHIEPVLGRNFDINQDSIMVCGSPSLNKECRQTFKHQDWQEGNTGEMGNFMLERAFAD
jgi:ferredoxin/flavodoxin---NADP+ reductase